MDCHLLDLPRFPRVSRHDDKLLMAYPENDSPYKKLLIKNSFQPNLMILVLL